MAQEIAHDALRDMAAHRGFKLVKSRRRKPGTGDYGKFGLLDANGKPVLGMGEEGVTATAQEIEAYLRASATGTWKQSAETTPDRPRSADASKIRGEERAPASQRIVEGGSGGARRMQSSDRASESRQGRAVTKRNNARHRTTAPRGRMAPVHQPLPSPPDLRATAPLVRAAKPGDGVALAELINQLRGLSVDQESVARNFAAARRGRGGIWIATEDRPVGLCAWTLVTTLHRGPVGRISLLIVDKSRRRKGLGTLLLTAVREQMKKSGCEFVEVMSDIDLSNSHGFFRSSGFAQASYRFTLSL